MNKEELLEKFGNDPQCRKLITNSFRTLIVTECSSTEVTFLAPAEDVFCTNDDVIPVTEYGDTTCIVQYTIDRRLVALYRRAAKHFTEIENDGIILRNICVQAHPDWEQLDAFEDERVQLPYTKVLDDGFWLELPSKYSGDIYETELQVDLAEAIMTFLEKEDASNE